MRYVSYVGPDGQPSFGWVEGEQVFDIPAATRGDVAVLADVLSRPGFGIPARRPDPLELSTLTLLPAVPAPGKVLCIGVNYDDHRVETGRDRTAHPVVFTRFADTLVGHDGVIELPAASEQLDYEGELAVVVGQPAWRVSEARALEHVAGYSCFNDGSVRDWQRHTHQFTPGKNFPRSGALGPMVVTPDELPPWDAITLTTRVSGETLQHAAVKDLLFPVARLLSYISTFTPLAPGDVIATGTPAGVGAKRTPPRFLRDGDVVEVEISGVGVLRTTVRAAPAN